MTLVKTRRKVTSKNGYKHIHRFVDGTRMYFATGKFDNWAVNISLPNKRTMYPKDSDYMAYLKRVAEAVGYKELYDFFVEIYDATTKELDKEVIKKIIITCWDWLEDGHVFAIWMVFLYAAMIAEENKAGTILGKKVKRLGMYQLLIEKQSIGYAANSSRGKSGHYLLEICDNLGF